MCFMMISIDSGERGGSGGDKGLEGEQTNERENGNVFFHFQQT